MHDVRSLINMADGSGRATWWRSLSFIRLSFAWGNFPVVRSDTIQMGEDICSSIEQLPFYGYVPRNGYRLVSNDTA